MAYTDQKMSGGKLAAIVIVVLIHLALGYAFVTGLAYQYIKKQQEKLNTFDVTPPPPPPPPENPPPPPPDQPNLPPPPTTVVSPPPIVPPTPTFQIQTSPVIPPRPQPTAIPAPARPPTPPAVPSTVVSQAAGAKGNPADWITNDDYPESSKRAQEAGTSAIAWTISVAGRVENCHTTSSSGSRALDDAACRAITRRGRYSPALNAAGQAISVTQTRRVVWVLPPE